MFEAQAAYYLNKYLGQYVDGVDSKSLRISVWEGNVVLENLRVRPEALEDLKLPITVKAGMLGTLTLKVPWATLGKEPVVVEIDKLYILAAPFEEQKNFESEEEVQQFADTMEKMERAAKRQRVETAELDFIEKLNKKSQKGAASTPAGGDEGGFLQSYIETIIANLELRITNVHVRYEDDQTSPGQRFAVGFTLGELSAHTVDDKGNRAFITAQEMKQVRKAVNLRRLAVYFDVSNKLWHDQHDWSQLPKAAWDTSFLQLIHNEIDAEASQSFLLRPVDGSMKYRRRMKKGGGVDEFKQEIDLRLQEIAVHVSRGQYEHVQNLLTVFNLYELSFPHRHLRPPCRPVNSVGARLWWTYACNAVKHRMLGNEFPLHKLKQICEMRRKYVKRYVQCLTDANIGVGGDDAIAAMDGELPECTILVFRQMAHVKVDHENRKALAEEATAKAALTQSTGWLEWVWGPANTQVQGQPGDEGESQPEPGEKDEGEDLSVAPEEWQKFHELMAVEIDDGPADSADTFNTLFTVRVNSAAMILEDESGQTVLEGVLKGTTAVSKMYAQNSSLQLTVMSTGLLCADGVLLSTGIEQIIAEEPNDATMDSVSQALKILYTKTPQDKGVSAALKVQLGGSYVTYRDTAVRKVLKFFRPVASADISVLQAQAAAGVKKATQLAGEQIVAALNETPMFEIDLCMDAPKIAIPVQGHDDNKAMVTLIADLGSFGLMTHQSGFQNLPPEHAGKYECLKADMQDVALYLVEGKFQWPELHNGGLERQVSAQLRDFLGHAAKVVPVLEPFALQSDVQLTRGWQPGLVPVRLDLNVASFHLHFSPTRYARIMTIVNSLFDLSAAASSSQSVWTHSDASSMHGGVSVLAWEGLGGRTPVWRKRYATVHGGNLYVSESEIALDIVKSVWLLGDIYVSAVPPSLVWGKRNVVAIVPLSVDLKSGVEMATSTVLHLDSEEKAQNWRMALIQEKERMAAATGIVEAPTVDTAFLSSLVSEELPETSQISTPVYLEVTGNVAELAVTILGRPPKDLGDPDGSSMSIAEDDAGSVTLSDLNAGLNMDNEVPLIVFREENGHVDLTVGEFGLQADLQVQSCELEDVLISKPSGIKRYLARSTVASNLEDVAISNRGDNGVLESKDNYVSLHFVTWSPSSKEYQGVDMELKVEFASILWECHRPTIAALISFGLDVTLAMEEVAAEEAAKASQPGDLGPSPSWACSESSTQFLWEDPERTLFRLSLVMEEVRLDLNYEDAPDCHLASGIFQNFTFDLDVNPANIELKSALGNAKIFDKTLPEDHPYQQICGLRADTTASLIEVEFSSHTPTESIYEDRVPTGSYFYTFRAEISAVDVVFYYRFINEFLVYLWVTFALEPPELMSKPADMPQGVVAAALKAAGVEEHLGGMVLLDIELAAPVVRLPPNSDSEECIFADLGQAEVSNKFTRIHSSDRDAVVNDIHIVLGNMSGSVYRNGCQGENLIEEMGDGVIIDVQMLQDSTGMLPGTRACIDVPQLHAKVTDEDYAFILSAIIDNFSVATKIPPDAFNLTVKMYPEALQLQFQSASLQESQSLNSPLTRMSTLSKGKANLTHKKAVRDASGSQATQAQVRVGSAQLTLLNAQSASSSTLLGSIRMSSFYCSYKSDSPTNMEVSVCIPSVEMVDLRPDAPELNAIVLSSGGSAGSVQDNDNIHRSLGDEEKRLSPSLLVLHYACRGDEQSLKARFQRPTLMLELGFGVSALEFAVPSLSLGRKVNKEFVTRDILLCAEPFVADGDLWLSPETRLLADSPSAECFVFDGNGHRLIVPEGITPQEPLPLVLVGVGKTLRFRNVKIVNSLSLNSIIQLQPGSQVTVSAEDGVEMLIGDDPMNPSGAHVSHAVRKAEAVLLRQANRKKQAAMAYLSFEAVIVATGVNLQLIDHRNAETSADHREVYHRLLSVQFDLQFDYSLDGTDCSLDAKVSRLLVETATKVEPNAETLQDSAQPADHGSCVEGRVLEPCNVNIVVTQTSGNNQEVHINVSQLVVSITPDLLDLVLHVHDLVLDPVTVASVHRPTMNCSTYQSIWSSHQGSTDSTSFNEKSGHDRKGWITFWRPQPPAGYCSLGDVVTCGEKQCNDEVIAIALNSGFAAHPTSYTTLWQFGGVTVWMPVPPSGYSAIGCLAKRGSDPPPVQACCCPHSSLLVEAALGECVWPKPPANLWRVENAACSFVVATGGEHMPRGHFLDLRSPIGVPPSGLSHIPAFSSMVGNAHPMVDRRMSFSSNLSDGPWTALDLTAHSFEDFSKRRKENLRSQTAKKLAIMTVEFKRIWVDSSVKGGQGGGIWRPIPPAGYVITGDCVEVDGISPPKGAIVLHESSHMDNIAVTGQSRLLECPIGYQCIWKQQAKRGLALSIWKPVPKPGYVALGYVAEQGGKPPPVGLIRCVRADAVKQASERGATADMEMVLRKNKLFFWLMDPQTCNFVTSTSPHARPRAEMWQLKTEQEKKPLAPTQQNQKDKMHVTIKSGPASIQMCDVVRMPIVEVEVQDIAFALTKQSSIAQCYTSLQACVHSYNAMLRCWEPILQNSHFIVHLDQNSSSLEESCIAPGSSMRITSTEETIHLTLAYAAVSAMFEAYREYQIVHEDKNGASRHQQRSIGVDSSRLPTSVINMLGLPAFVLLDFGDVQEVVELDPAECQTVLQPLPQLPQRHSVKCKPMAPERVLMVGILEALVKCPGSDDNKDALRELYCCVRLGDSVPTKHRQQGIRTRPVTADKKGVLQWNEQFILTLPSKCQEGNLRLALELWESSRDVDGFLVCTASVELEECLLRTTGKSIHRTVKMADEVDTCYAGVCVSLEAELSSGSLMIEEEPHSTAGDRALRLHPGDDWVHIPSSGAQRARNSSTSVPTLVLPVPLGEGMALEATFGGRMRREVLRSLCSFVNATQLTLQVRIVEVQVTDWEMPLAPSQSYDSFGSVSLSEVVEEEVFENCRFTPLKGWGAEGQGLLPTDRKRFSLSASGARNSMAFPTFDLPDGWEWDGPWAVDKAGYVDADGWAYASSFLLMKYPPSKGAQKKGPLDFCRRRRWIRRRRRKRSAKENEPQMVRTIVVGDALPGGTLPLPLAWSEGHWQLQVLPLVGTSSWHGWSGAPIDDGQGLRLDSLVDGLTTLVVCELEADAQATVQGCSSPMTDDWLCHASYWISLITEGRPLPTVAGHAQLTDWSITAYPPLMLHNALPLSGSCIIWEQPTQDSALKVRQQSRLEAGASAQIHLADMRKEVRLSFYPDGHDFSEPEPVTISRGYCENAAGVSGLQQLPAHFQVAHKGSTMQVQMERSLDIGFSLRDDQGMEELEPAAAVAVGYPLTLHLYSPLWIVNRTEVTMCVAIVHQHIGRAPSEHSELSEEDSEEVESDTISKRQDFQVVDILPEGRSIQQTIVAQCTVEAYCRDIISYSTHDRRPYYVRIGVLGSGWSPPMPLNGNVMSSKGTDGMHTLQTEAISSHRMLMRAQVPEVRTTYSIVASLDMSGSGNLRTKVLHLEPHVVVSNRTGFDLQIAQLPQGMVSMGLEEVSAFGNQIEAAAMDTVVCPTLPAGAVENPLHWQIGCAPAVICVRPLLTDLEGTVLHQPSWSQPIKIGHPGTDDIHAYISGWPYCDPPFLRAPQGVQEADASADRPLVGCVLKLTTRIKGPGTLHVVCHGAGLQPPYTIENRTLEPLRFRHQVGASWHMLPPLSARGWILPRLIDASKQVEIQGVSDAGNLPICGYSLDEDADLPPMSMSEGYLMVEGRPSSQQQLPLFQGYALVEVVDEDDIASGGISAASVANLLTSVSTWGRRRLVRVHPYHPASCLQNSKMVGLGLNDESPFNKAYNVVVGMNGLMISLVDHRPQEVLTLSFDGVCIEAATGVGSRGRFSQVRLKVNAVQLDDQLPGTASPVVLSNWNKDAKKGGEEPPILNLMFVKELGRRHGRIHFPTMCIKIGGFQVNLHERLIWKVLDMFQLLWYDRREKFEGTGEQLSSDLDLEIDLLSVADFWIKASLTMDPLSRPRYAAARILSLGLEFANVEDVEFLMRGFEKERLTMAQSVFVNQILVHLRDQFWRIMRGLLEYYFSVGGASKGLAAMGRVLKTVTGVEDVKESAKVQSSPSKIGTFHEGLLGGGEALAKGVIKGAAGIVSKPVQGAKEHGVGGFMKGVGKGLLGAAVNPVSGVFEAASKIAEGIDVLADDIKISLTGNSAQGYLQRRLPLCIGGDRVLRPFDRETAAGQALMYVALWHGGRRSRRATKYDDEAYGGHELLLDANVLLWTNKRLMLINIPGVAEWLRHVAAGSSPAHIPDLTLIWDIEWNNLLAINLLRAMQGDSTPALLVYSRAKQITFPNFLRAIRCPANEIWMLRQKIWETHQRYVVFSPRMLAYTRSVSCNNIAGSSSPPALLSADFRWMWRSEGKGRAVSVWRPLGPPGYVALGDVAVIGSADPSSPVAMLLDDSNTATADGRRSRVAAPLGFHIIFRSTHHSLTVWEPIPPDGYCAMGCMVVSGIETPPIGIVRCLRRDLVMCTQFFDAALWKGQSSDIDTMVSSFWLKDQNPLSTFWAVRGVDRPHSSLSLVPKPEAVRSDAC